MAARNKEAVWRIVRRLLVETKPLSVGVVHVKALLSFCLSGKAASCNRHDRRRDVGGARAPPLDYLPNAERRTRGGTAPSEGIASAPDI